MQRLSAEAGRGSFDGDRRSSVASSLTSPRKESAIQEDRRLTEEPEEMGKDESDTKPLAPQRDILADMEAFQREIDELRKAQGSGDAGRL